MAALSINKLQIPVGNTLFYSTAFRNLIENYLSVLKQIPSTTTIPLTEGQQYQYQGNFYGLLVSLNIPQDLHWITLRLNGLLSPFDFTGDLPNLLVPSKDTLNQELTKLLTVTL